MIVNAAAIGYEPLCDLSKQPLAWSPFAHIVHDDFIHRPHYSQISRSFAKCPAKIGPTGYSLYWGDEGYDDLLRLEPAWRRLFDTFHSQFFIEWCLEQFSEVWEREGCLIDLSKARYVPYREDRVDKERPALRKVEHEPHELWVRMDIHQGQIGYDRPVHLDHARRLMSMLIYMCDYNENQMIGGELLLHAERHSAPVSIVRPWHNRMIAFPCANRSYHSVSRIIAQRAPRNYVQVHISSSVDVWARPAVPIWRRALGKVKRSVKSAMGSSA